MDGFVSIKSKNLFSRLNIDRSFLQDTAVKLMQDFHGKIMAKEEQKQYLLLCVQEHRKLYPDCKKETLKRKYSH